MIFFFLYRWGSLIAETDFVVADTTYVLSKFLEAIVYLLQSNKPIDIDGISGNVLCIQLENGNFIQFMEPITLFCIDTHPQYIFSVLGIFTSVF